MIKHVLQDHVGDGEPDYSHEDWEFIFRLIGKEIDLGEWNGDWLHPENPLVVSKTTTEWILVKLIEKLEAELLELRKNLGMKADMK